MHGSNDIVVVSSCAVFRKGVWIKPDISTPLSPFFGDGMEGRSKPVLFSLKRRWEGHDDRTHQREVDPLKSLSAEEGKDGGRWGTAEGGG